MSKQREWAIITLVLLLAAALRLWGLGEVPPGLDHDEVANWLIARDILAGHHSIYFTSAYGHEPLYQYAQATAVALFGDHWLGLRWPSVAFGLLGIAATYALIRRLFDVPVALLTVAWLVASFWPLFYARVALRAVSLFFTAAISAFFLIRVTNPPASQSTASGVVNWIFTGFFLGLSLYTYMSARILPVIFVLFLIYFFFVHSFSHIPWRRLIIFLLTAAFVSAPLVVWLTAHPGAEYRVGEVREPLDRLFAGDPSLVWQNLVANLKFFTCVGDPWPYQNLPGRPVFADPVSAVLFYAGLLVALWRWRDPKYGFLLIWLTGALVPSIITSVAPSSIRDILALVVTFVFPALALVETGHWVNQRMQDARRKMRDYRFPLFAFCCLLLAPCLFLTVRDYFFRWPADSAVRFDYQADLTTVAHRLDKLPAGAPVTVAGLSVHSMDGPGLDLAARRDVHDVRLCDTRETLVVPAGRDVWLFVPRVVPFDIDLRERLLKWGAVVEADSQSSFTSYRLPDDTALRRDMRRLENEATLPNGVPVALPVSFGGRLAFWGYEWLQRSSTPGDSLVLLTYWRVETPPSMALKVFIHLVGESETPITQHDGLGSPPRGWAAGDLVVQKHIVFIPGDLPSGRYRLQVGLYDSATNIRLPVLTADRLLLYSLEVAK